MNSPDLTRGYVHMPKTGGTSVREALRDAGWLPTVVHHPDRVLRSHIPARDMPDGMALFATLRHPWAWYASWYDHLRRALPNERCERVLRHYGRGSIEWEDVLEGLLHPEDLGEMPFRGDPLFNPAGEILVEDGGLYATHVRHYLQDAFGEWLVDTVVPTKRIGDLLPLVVPSVQVPHRNGRSSPMPAYDGRVRGADLDLYRSAPWMG